MSVGVSVNELEGQFDIKQFEATCAVKSLSTASTEATYVAIMSPPLFGADGDNFRISVGWMTRKAARESEIMPDPNSKVGVKLHFGGSTSGAAGRCHVKFDVKIVNVEPFRNLGAAFGNYRLMTANSDCRGWAPDFERPTGFSTIKDICDPSQGWLHDGALRIKAKLMVAIDDQALGASSAVPHPQNDLSKNFGALFSSGAGSDVVIKTNDENVHAHALVLSARSSVFAAMLSTPMREGKSKEIVIDDISGSAVRSSIAFLYSGEVDTEALRSDTSVLGILQAAHRYNVPSLVDLCVNELMSRLHVTTVAEWFYIADLIGSSTLRTRCLEFIRLHISQVQATDKFAEFVATRPSLMAEILASFFPPAKRLRTDEA